jgi:hypothetical protein
MDTLINLFINPKEESEETIEVLNKYNKVTFKKDSLETYIAFSYQMMV